MQFTLNAYESLLNKLKSSYSFCNYHNYKSLQKCVILRHDIDYSPKCALKLANIEKKLGITSTYFALLTSDFYNPISSSCLEILTELSNLGHEIGLHFDETQYPDFFGNTDKIKVKIIREIAILEQILGTKVKVVSFHRPSREVLNSSITIPNVVNAYDKEFMCNFKYLSDSRRNWREPVDEMVESGLYPRLNILTHAFWYSEQEESLQKAISTFVNSGNIERYRILEKNIAGLTTIMEESEVQ